MKKHQLTLLIVLLFLLQACNKKAFVPIYNSEGTIEEQLTAIYKGGQLPGFAVAIVNKKGIQYEQAFGYADVANKTPYTKNTQQNIASISKTFIGIALMKAIEMGKLSLETPINDILPFSVQHPQFPNTPITIQHLATHTSSIDDHEIEYKSVHLKSPMTLTKKDLSKEHLNFFKHWSNNAPTTLSDFLKQSLLPKGDYYNKIRFSEEPPGGRYQYSNLGASLLAYIIEEAVDQSYSYFVQTQILKPVKMNQTQYNSKKQEGLNKATTYFQNQLEVPNHQSILYPSGGYYSTAADLSLYLIELLKCYEGDGELVTKETMLQMIQPQLSPQQSPPSATKNRGIIWTLNRQDVGHNGGNYGVVLFMTFNKKENFGRLFMTNISSYKDQALIPQMVEIWNLLGKEGKRLSK